jgi:hypothetical protein
MTVSSPSSTLAKPSIDGIERSASSTSVSSAVRATQVSASVYKIDHQVKYLHLQAETDALLQQLQLLQQTRRA